MTLKSVFGSTSPALAINAADVLKALAPYAITALTFVGAHAAIPGHPFATAAIAGLVPLAVNLIHLYLGDQTAK